MRSKQDPFEKAREYAFLLLKFRLRSEKELYSRLKHKKFPDDVIKNTIKFLKDKQFIDDSAFVKVWASSRIKRRLGLRRIKDELRVKGVDSELIDSAVSEINKDYCESRIIRDIAEERLNRLKGVEPYKAKQKVYAYLLRRGFLPETITDILNQLCSRAN
ncbi:MAG: regulatory protein RecX [Candidatus Omnitrophota bacterium]